MRKLAILLVLNFGFAALVIAQDNMAKPMQKETPVSDAQQPGTDPSFKPPKGAKKLKEDRVRKLSDLIIEQQHDIISDQALDLEYDKKKLDDAKAIADVSNRLQAALDEATKEDKVDPEKMSLDTTHWYWMPKEK